MVGFEAPAGIEAQLTLTEGASRRGLKLWMRGDEFLACASFTEDQDGRPGGRGQLHLGQGLRRAGLSPMIS